MPAQSMKWSLRSNAWLCNVHKIAVVVTWFWRWQHKGPQVPLGSCNVSQRCSAIWNDPPPPLHVMCIPRRVLAVVSPQPRVKQRGRQSVVPTPPQVGCWHDSVRQTHSYDDPVRGSPWTHGSRTRAGGRK